MVKVVIENVSKSFKHQNETGDNYLRVLNNINITIQEGQFVTLFGPNACGKTTLLKIIAGFEKYDEGKVEVNGKVPGEVNTGFIFQNYTDSLLPWKRVIDNVTLPLRLRGSNKKDARNKAEALLEKLSIHLPLDSFPYQLSAGQQQMVAIARALVSESELLLLDEPFSSLDFQTRISMQKELLRIWQKTKVSILFVSHEIEEAIFLADRLVLLTKQPGTVKKEIDIDLPRPRGHQLLESDEFNHLKAVATKPFLETF